MKFAAHIFLAVLLALLSSLGAAREPFDNSRFTQLQDDNAVVLVHIEAEWCSICAIQKRVLNMFKRDHPDVPVHILTVDFDTEKAQVKQFRAPRQSTFALYRGHNQVWFSVAEVRPDIIYGKIINASR